MGGLLYKDFISINRIGKAKLTWLITAYVFIFIILRIVFSGNRDLEEFLVTNENGEIVNIMDAFFLMLYVSFILLSVSWVSVSKIMTNDEKNKTRIYYDSMPVEKNTYVASKYLFIIIAAYVFMSLDYIVGISCAAFCREGFFLDINNMLNSFVLNFISIILILAAIELPLHISLGKEKAARVMVIFWTAIAVPIIGYLMFGDLTVFSDWDIMALLDYLEKHMNLVFIFQMFQPIVVLGLFYASYLISCKLYCNKEDR